MPKCRIVSHGNQYKDKDLIWKDSSTDQFPAIRLALPLTVILGLTLATLDVKSAYPQAGNLNRERPIYVRPPRGWDSSSWKLCELLKQAYRIFESGRIWQLIMENFFWEYEIVFAILGVQQLLVKRNSNDEIVLLIAKLVDDTLLAGIQSDIEDLLMALKTKFTIKPFTMGTKHVSDRLNIYYFPEFSVEVSMEDYFCQIHPFPLHRQRHEKTSSICTPEELIAFKSLTSSIN